MDNNQLTAKVLLLEEELLAMRKIIDRQSELLSQCLDLFKKLQNIVGETGEELKG